MRLRAALRPPQPCPCICQPWVQPQDPAGIPASARTIRASLSHATCQPSLAPPGPRPVLQPARPMALPRSAPCPTQAPADRLCQHLLRPHRLLGQRLDVGGDLLGLQLGRHVVDRGVQRRDLVGQVLPRGSSGVSAHTQWQPTFRQAYIAMGWVLSALTHRQLPFRQAHVSVGWAREVTADHCSAHSCVSEA